MPPIEKATLEYECNAIARAVNDEYPDLKIVFLLYDGDTIQSAFKAKQSQIEDHPAGAPFVSAFENHAHDITQSAQWLGVSTAVQNHIIPFLSKTKVLSLSCIKRDDYDAIEDLKIDLYGCIWQTIRTYKALRHKGETRENNGIHTLPTEDKAKENLYKDIYAVLMMQLSGRKNMIQYLAERRCKDALRQFHHYRPEDYPFPIGLDATHLVYEDLKAKAKPKQGAFDHAYDMACEVQYACKDQFILQWQAFVEPIQEMVWMGYSIPDILGTAIYTSENAYNRSIGYLVADILDTEPSPITKIDGYNPFADEDTLQRLHLKSTQTTWEKTIQILKDKQNPDVLIAVAKAQCDNMLSGYPIGWAAPILAKTAQDLTQTASGTEPLEKRAKQLYLEYERLMPWGAVQETHIRLLTQRRYGKTITFDTLIETLQHDGISDECAAALTYLKQRMEAEPQIAKLIVPRGVLDYYPEEKPDEAEDNETPTQKPSQDTPLEIEQ